MRGAQEELAGLVDELVVPGVEMVGGIRMVGSGCAPLGTVSAFQLKRLVHCATSPEVWLEVDSRLLDRSERQELLDVLRALPVYRMRSIVQNSHEGLFCLLVSGAARGFKMCVGCM